MIRLFGGKPDHPLADPREVRQIMAELEKQPALAAIDDITVWLESLTRADGISPQQQIETLLQFDAAAQFPLQRLALEFVAYDENDKQKKSQLWQLVRGLLTQLLSTYEIHLQQLLARNKTYDHSKALLPILLARQLHTHGLCLKWDQLHYGPFAADFWSQVGRLYLLAVEHKIDQKNLPLFEHQAAISSAAEYLKMLVFQASSMDNLLQEEIELAAQLIAHLLPGFHFGSQFRDDSVYWVDCATALPPTRLAKSPEPSPTLRFFSAGAALKEIESLRGHIAAHKSLPPQLNLHGQHGIESVQLVLDHLALYWAAVPPMREHTRHAVKSRLCVIRGFAAMHRALGGPKSSQKSESWSIEDVSQGGIGAQMQIAGGEKLAIGELLAMQPEGGNNWLAGVVRRLHKDQAGQGSVGIETLSKTPAAMQGDSDGMRTDFILLEPYAHTDMVRLLIPKLAWEEDIPLTFTNGKHFVRLRPNARLDEGEDFVLGRYKVEIQEELI